MLPIPIHFIHGDSELKEGTLALHNNYSCIFTSPIYKWLHLHIQLPKSNRNNLSARPYFWWKKVYRESSRAKRILEDPANKVWFLQMYNRVNHNLYPHVTGSRMEINMVWLGLAGSGRVLHRSNWINLLDLDVFCLHFVFRLRLNPTAQKCMDQQSKGFPMSSIFIWLSYTRSLHRFTHLTIFMKHDVSGT